MNPLHSISSLRFSINTIRKSRSFVRLLALLALVSIAAITLAATSSSANVFGPIFTRAAAVFGSKASAPETKAVAERRFSPALNSAGSAGPLSPVSAMATERRGHTATRLSDGRVLIAGGENTNGVLNQTEIYDATTDTFSAGSNMSDARVDHTATLLSDGRVLIAGGRSSAGALATTEIFDPTSGTFSSGPNMSVARAGHSATLFADGRILFAGGDAGGSAEILNASLSGSTAVGSLSTARSMHSAALLQDGRVLIVGGRDAGGNELMTGEIFDTPAGSFSNVDSSLKVSRVQAWLRVLFDGKVQVIGGNNDGSMEIYDPMIERFGAYAHVAPEGDTCVGLPDQVKASQTRAALFHNGQSDATFDRSSHTMSELGAQAIVIGGANSSGTVLNSTLFFGSSTAEISSDKIDYAPGETAHISGRGFQAGETVRLKIHEDPHTPQERGLDSVADGDGSFSGDYLVQQYDLDMKFLVGARGLTSGRTAQTTFTDAADVHTVRGQTVSPITVTITATRYTANESCTGASTPLGTFPLTSVASTIDSNNANGQSIKLTAPATASTPAGFTFANWTSPSGGAFDPVVGDPNSICIGGSNGNQIQTYTPNYAATNVNTTTAVDNKSSTYGDSSVTLTATVTPASGPAINSGSVTFTVKQGATIIGTATTDTSVVSGAASVSYALPAGTNAGPYTIQADYSPGTGFNASSGTGTLTISKRAIEVTADTGQFKTYGDADPTFTYTITSGSLVSPNAFTGALSRASGENVGLYAITIGTLAINDGDGGNNYTLSFVSKNFEIKKRAATWTTNAASKTYGDSDPTPLTTGSGSNFVAADNVTATYNRAAGGNASPPTYHITATLSATPASALDNYIITNNGAEFTINKRAANWTTNAASKTYGDADPSPLTTGSGSNFVAADNVTATYSRAAGENASPPTYHITATLSAATPTTLDNYIVTNNGAEFTINKRAATWTTNAASKTYGDADPSPLTTGSGSNFVAADNVTATYSRAAGENASPPTYHITATLSAATPTTLDNYIVTNNGAEFTINKRAATWTTNAASKTYGDVDPSPLTTGSGSNFVAADNVTATYNRAAGENASPPTYHITATLSAATPTTLDNYIVTNNGSEFTINKRAATWTTNAASKTYGDADPSPLTTGNGSNFVAADNVTAAYTRVAGENASPPTYHITATLSATPLSALDNYIITNNGAEFTINKRTASWTTNPNSKTYGDVDPTPLTTGSGSNFVAADTVTATYTRVAGEVASPPTYHITATLSATPLSALDNYVITNAGAEFTINKRAATWTTNPNSKTYGDSDPVPLTTGSGSNFIAADGVTATYSRVTGENASPPTYHITATLSATGDLNNYIIANDGAEFTINKRTATWSTNPNSKTYGEMDPNPLTIGSGSNFIAGDGVTATYSRVAGENAIPPTYHITATLSATGDLNNYIITNDGAEFTIQKRLATWTTNPNSKTYGDVDPNPLTTGSGSNFIASDGVTVSYSRVAGENASPPTYHITATLSAAGDLNNYIITNNGADFTVSKRAATWTTNPNSKTYGDSEPVPLTTGSGSNFIAADGVSATYSRVAGENASPPTYHITATLNATPLSALDNYVITNEGAEFTINKRAATWTTNPNSKTYGNVDPSPLTTGSGSNFVAADNVTATYSRAAGQSASPPTYHITATLNATPMSALDNYVITNAGAEFTIDKRPITITANDRTKTYGESLTLGTAAFITNGNTALGETITSLILTSTGNLAGDVNASAGTYTGNIVPSAPTGGGGFVAGNYIITFNSGKLTISQKAASVTANNKGKIYGLVNPPLDATVTGTVNGDILNYTLATTATQFSGVGPYPITVTLGLNSNYIVTKTDGTLTITTAFCFNGFLSPIGGSVETLNGGTFIDPVRSFKLGSTIPVKFAINSWNGTTCGAPIVTGIHTLQAVFYSSSLDSDPPIDATPTDAATDGNQFRLTDNEWHFNLSTKGGGFKAGTWILKATLQDGSTHTVWITIKK